MVDNVPLILTAQSDPISAELFERLRRQHFPAALNKIPAHLTLFHHLPGDELQRIDAILTTLCATQAQFPFCVQNLRLLGRGVAFAVEAPELMTLRQMLVNQWSDRLTRQDRQPFKPHITVQNKVTPEVAQKTAQDLLAYLPVTGQIKGLLLWQYLNGPWALTASYPFSQRP